MNNNDEAKLFKKINKLNKKIHRAEGQRDTNRLWWRKIKLKKLKNKLGIKF